MDYNNKTQAGAELPLVWPVYEAALVVRSSSSEFVFQRDCLKLGYLPVRPSSREAIFQGGYFTARMWFSEDVLPRVMLHGDFQYFGK